MANLQQVMWRKIECKSSELRFTGTLNGGQSFRWIQKNNEWIGVFKNIAWILKQDETGIYYRVLGSLSLPRYKSNVPQKRKLTNLEEDDDMNGYYDKCLHQYFRLDVDLESHCQNWASKDPNFAVIAKSFKGIRVLNQEPIENIFSFICSSNNNISRITSLVEKLCTNYGKKICEIEEISYHNFPEVQELAGNEVEENLRKLSFGYRAKYINQTAKRIVELGEDKWISTLLGMSYNSAKEELMQLPGIGAKVADCICLMSLGHLSSVPVDTHVFQIACSPCYLPHLSKSKTVTKKIYQEIGDHFRELYGPLAGWAQTILFCADLKSFNGNQGPTKRKK